MSLLKKRDYYKPFTYPWAYDYYKKVQKMHWLPEEVPLQEDVADWLEKLNDKERNLLTQLFRFFTQGDVDIATGYGEEYIPTFSHPELRMMFFAIGAGEANHVDSYAQLLDTIGMPETEYKAFHEYDVMRKKHEYMFLKGDSDLNKIERMALKLAVFSAFGEGMQLFSSFAMLLSFKQRNLMKGMSTIVEWSIRDESLHVEAMVMLFHTLVKENPKIWNDKLKAAIYQTCRDMVELEDQFIDLAFEMGDLELCTAADTKLFIRNIADRRLLQLGLKPNYGVTENPYDWLDWLMNAHTHTNFFEGRATEYTKGGVSGWDKAYAFLDQPRAA